MWTRAMKELVYTSARSGLRPGTTGFCTVALSDGLPAAVVEFLERLSNTYRPVYMPYDPRAADNPVAVSLIRGRPGGQPVAVLSRNAAAGTDHTGRSNNIAHHLVFDGAGPRDGSNPAAVAAQPGTFLPRWDDQPRRLPARAVAGSPGPRGVCRAWADLTGDPGWAATVAAAWADRSARPLYLIYPAGTNILELLSEAASLLPADRRWDATFTTYYTGLPPEAVCVVRGVLAGTPQEAEARRADHVDLMDLVGPAPDGPLADRARGRAVPDEAPPPMVVDAVPPPRKPAPIPVSRAEPVEATTLVPLDEPPPAVQPSRPFQGFRSDQAAMDERRTGNRWGLIVSVLFGLWALLSSGVAAFMAVGWANARGDKAPTELVQPSVEQNPGRAGPEPHDIQAKEVPHQNNKSPSDQNMTANLERQLAEAQGKFATEKARADRAEVDLKVEQQAAKAERARAEEADRLRKKAEEEAKTKVRPGSFDDWYSEIEMMPAAERLVAYYRLDHQELEKRQRAERVAAGSLEFVPHKLRLEPKGKDGKNETKDVWRVKTDPPKMLSPKKTYAVVGFYTSTVKPGDIPTYIPKEGSRVEKFNALVKFQDDSSFSEGLEKGGFHYVEPSDIGLDIGKETKVIFVMTEDRQPSHGLLMWVKKKG